VGKRSTWTSKDDDQLRALAGANDRYVHANSPVYPPDSFKARLVDPSTGRNLWVSSGEVRAGGRLFVGNGSSASSSVSAIFDDLRVKKIIGAAS